MLPRIMAATVTVIFMRDHSQAPIVERMVLAMQTFGKLDRFTMNSVADKKVQDSTRCYIFNNYQKINP